MTNPRTKGSKPVPTRGKPRSVEIVVYPGEDSGFVAEAPRLPGCVSQGADRDEAVRNAREALEGLLLSYEQAGHDVPWADDVQIPADADVTLVEI